MDVSVNGGGSGSGGRRAIAERHGDKGFESFGAQCRAIAIAARWGQVDPRLVSAAATGGSEAIGADGGYLVQTEFATALLERIYNSGQILSRVSRQTVSQGFNRLQAAAIDETSRVDGSRWGGLNSYWAAEADTLTATKPRFDSINLTLHKLIVLAYATDEVLEDAPNLDALLRRIASDELRFKFENSLVRGTGAGMPLGLLNSGAKIVVAAEGGQSAGTVIWLNILHMYERLWAGSLPTAIWLVHQSLVPQLAQMSIALGTAGAVVPAYDANEGTLMGIPVVVSEYCEAPGTEGDIILADWKEYVTAEKAIMPTPSMHVLFLTDQMAFRFVWRIDGQPVWRVPVTPYKGNLTQSPFVTLATRS